MSEVQSAGPPPKEDPALFVLRAKARPAVRFRRGLIVAMSAGVSAITVAIAILALRPHSLRLVPSDGSAAPIGRTMPEAIGNAPAAYSDVPKLGPPLPGDLGRPILERQRELSSDPKPNLAPIAAGERQRRQAFILERRQADELNARTSPLIAKIGATSTAPASVEAALQPHLDDAETVSSSAADHEAAYGEPEVRAVSRFAPSQSGSGFLLTAGTVIPASLITAVNSDLPGLVVAEVTENLRDSLTGRTILIPQGARLIGRYEHLVTYGQKRALLVWNRILFPNGTSLTLDKVPAIDAAGEAGLKDHVNAHEWQLLKGVVLSSLLGVGSELGLGRESALVHAIRQSTQQNAAEAGQQLVARDLDVQPTLVIRQGWPVRALLNKDLVLPAWKE